MNPAKLIFTGALALALSKKADAQDQRTLIAYKDKPTVTLDKGFVQKGYKGVDTSGNDILEPAEVQGRVLSLRIEGKDGFLITTKNEKSGTAQLVAMQLDQKGRVKKQFAGNDVFSLKDIDRTFDAKVKQAAVMQNGADVLNNELKTYGKDFAKMFPGLQAATMR